MQHKLKIHGMHCVSCEILLEKSLNKISGVKVISANHKSGDINIEINDNSKLNDIETEIKKMNYTLLGNNSNKNNVRVIYNEERKSAQDYIEIIGSFLVIGTLIYLFKDLDLSNKLPDISGNVGVIIALLVGVVASISTCLALLGGIVISLGSTIVECEKEKTSWEKARPHIYFNLGRIAGFAVLGGLLGFIGTKFIVSPGINGIITILIAIMMFYIGLYILGFVPSITKFGIYLPKFFTKDVDNLSEKKHSLMPALIGVLTFFLPCGFTQSMQLVSIASGSAISGSLIMGAFALGTAPVLFMIGFGSSYAQSNKLGLFKKMIGVLVIFFAIFSFSNGLKLKGINLVESGKSKVESQETNQVVEQNNGEAQIINVVHTGQGLKPFSINLKEGKNYKLIITPESNGIGCMFAMFIPNINEEPRYIKKGEKIEYNIKGLYKGTFPIVCTAMGMEHGELVVE